MIVADCNLIAYLHLPGPQCSVAEAVLAKDREWCAPPVWRSEFRNILFAYVRTQHMTSTMAEAHWTDALSHLGQNQYEPDTVQVLAKALSTRLSAYDAEYVTLAEQLDVPLVTADQQILRTCRGIALSLEAFLHA